MVVATVWYLDKGESGLNGYRFPDGDFCMNFV